MEFKMQPPPEEERLEDRPWFITARARLSRLGVVLILTAIFSCLSNVVAIVVAKSLKEQNRVAEPPPNMTPEERKNWERGRSAAPLFDLIIIALPTSIYLPMMIAGGVLQRGLRREFGFAAAVIALMPCSPGFLVSLPVGIWALIVLNNQDVKAVFEHESRGETARERRRR